MDILIHADIFFFITTIFVVIVGTGFAVVIAYIVPILRNIGKISKIAKEETEKLAKDIEDTRSAVKKEANKFTNDIDAIRSSLKEEGFKIKSILNFALGLFTKPKKVVRKKKTNNN